MDAFKRWKHIPQSQKYFELSEGEQEQFDGVMSTIVKERRKTEKLTGIQQGDFLALNKKGLCPPIYWCFNNWAEALLLARKLGNNQPLVAMHSLHDATNRWRIKTRFHEHLALRYFEQIDLKNSESLLLLGGQLSRCSVG